MILVGVVICRIRLVLHLHCIEFRLIIRFIYRQIMYNGERNRQHRHSVISAGSYETGMSIHYDDQEASPDETHIFPANIEDDHYEFNPKPTQYFPFSLLKIYHG